LRKRVAVLRQRCCLSRPTDCRSPRAQFQGKIAGCKQGTPALMSQREILSHEKQIPMAIVVNKLIPEFEANATGGIKVSNTSHNGQVLVLYFYPKDNTPGCTTEAMQFRDKYKDFVKAGATVFGVSRDNMKSHDDFKAKLELPFELIADTEEKMCHMFGVVKNKIMYGKKVKGIERSTFLIGADGVLKQEWRGLKVPGHVDEVLKAVKLLKKAA
jgi:thioredoxin-dependent peroxiredoxin